MRVFLCPLGGSNIFKTKHRNTLEILLLMYPCSFVFAYFYFAIFPILARFLFFLPIFKIIPLACKAMYKYLGDMFLFYQFNLISSTLCFHFYYIFFIGSII